MSLEGVNPEESANVSDALLEEGAALLREVLATLASRIRPFPAFLNMVSVQAVELELTPGSAADRGCVVVLPNGEICGLDLKVVPGVQGVTDIDQVEEFQELDSPAEECIVYAAAAIRALSQELRRWGKYGSSRRWKPWAANG